MSVLPAAPFLVDFDAKSFDPVDVEEPPVFPAASGLEVQWADRVEEAYARGLEEGRRLAEAEAAAQLEEQKAEFEQHLAAAREVWCGEQGPQLAEQMAAAVRGAEDHITQSVPATMVLLLFMWMSCGYGNGLGFWKYITSEPIVKTQTLSRAPASAPTVTKSAAPKTPGDWIRDALGAR